MEKKLNFIPASQFNDSENYRYEVTLSKKMGLFFGRHVMETYDLRNQILKFYLDVTNNTIGWCVMRSGKLEDFKKTRGTGVKKINTNTISGVGFVDITVELKKMKLDLKKIESKKHAVLSYKNKGLIGEDNQIDYITLDEYAK